VGEEQFPTLVAPEHFQAQERFIALSAPELAASFHPALELAAGRFDSPRADGLVALASLLILHPLLVVLTFSILNA
jgi:hypothetical protein